MKQLFREKMQTPFFTIITSTLNVVKSIERCVESVTSQTFCAYEYIVVDGASTDGTVEFLEKNKELFATLISEPDTGIYNAWNKALKHARGEWILFLGADDILADVNVLANVAKFIKKHGAHSGIVYGDVMRVSKDTHQEKNLIKTLPESIGEQTIKKPFPKIPSHPGIFHHKDLFGEENFDERYKIAADSKFILDILIVKKMSILYFPRTINKMTTGGISCLLGLERVKEGHETLKYLNIPYSRFGIFLRYGQAYIQIFIRKFFGLHAMYVFDNFIRRLYNGTALWD